MSTGQPGRVVTGPIRHWSSDSGTPEDPFAGIPGAYADEDF